MDLLSPIQLPIYTTCRISVAGGCTGTIGGSSGRVFQGEYGNCDQNFPFLIVKVNRAPVGVTRFPSFD